MNLPDLRPEHHAQPIEIEHHDRWLELLLHKSRRSPAEAIPPFHVPTGLRTLVAMCPEQLRAADALVRRRYARRGYQLPQTDDSEAGPRRRFTLLAESGGELIGTLTVRPKGPLYAEQTYGAEIGSMRAQGRRIGEVVRLAVESGVDWKPALDALVQSTYLFTRLIHQLTDIVIEVNPRHARFYERIFGFVVEAADGFCARVRAPSVLLRLDLEQFGRRLAASCAA